AVCGERLDRPYGQEWAESKRHRGGVPHFEAHGVKGMRQTLSAPLGRAGQSIPTRRRPGLIGLLPTRRHGDGAVLEDGAVAIPLAIERRDDIIGKPACLFEHGIDEVFGQVSTKALLEGLLEPGGMLECEGHVANWRLEAHDRFRLNSCLKR